MKPRSQTSGYQVATRARTSGLGEEQWPSVDGDTEIRGSWAGNVDRYLTVANLRTIELYNQHAKAPENATQRARSNIEPMSVDTRIGGMLSSWVLGNLWYLCMEMLGGYNCGAGRSCYDMSAIVPKCIYLTTFESRDQHGVRIFGRPKRVAVGLCCCWNLLHGPWLLRQSLPGMNPRSAEDLNGDGSRQLRKNNLKMEHETRARRKDIR
jgi:hypothetical protein